MLLNVDFWSRVFWNNSLKEWAISIGILAGVILLARLFYWFLRTIVHQFTKRTATDIDDILLEELDTPTILLVILLGFRYAFELLHFSDGVQNFVERAFVLAIAIDITWFVVRIANTLVVHFLNQYSQKESSNVDASMILLAKRTVRGAFWTIGITLGLNNAGFDVGALIAGLGIGGLALALAAQDTVKNIFGGLMMFLDRPFRIGDNIIIDKYEGTVQYIGVRSTRIRLQNGRLVTIPNAQFTDKAIENISIEPTRRVSVSIGLTYDTTVEQIDQAIKILNEIVKNTQGVASDNKLVYFEQLNSSSLDIRFIYHILKGEEIVAVQSEVNRQILKRFTEAKLEFAYPTQTVYQK